MTMFDSGRYDLPTLIEKLRDQRFDGYDANQLATEVEKFRSGAGTASMGNAVAALKSVVGALAATDTTLRKQLAALGVTWQSKAGGQASAVLTEQAGFAGKATDNVTQAAQLIFEQGEAFNRTKNKLPDPQALRQGEDGFTFADSMFSLFGFETDHAKAVKSSIEAQAQTIDALNAYAHDSGDYLASSQAVPEPETLDTTVPPPAGAGLPKVGSPGGTPSIPDSSPTIAASGKDSGPVGPVTRQAPVQRPVVAPAAEAPTPAVGIPAAGGVRAPSQGGTTPQGATTPSSFAPPRTAPITPVTRTGSEFERPSPGRSVPGPIATGPIATGPGGPVTGGAPTGVPGTPGDVSTGKPATGGAWGKPGVGGGGEGLGRSVPPGGGEALLGKGRLSGVNTPAPSSSTAVGPGFSATKAPGGVGGIADGATAVGAGAVGGATNGEQERRNRGFGRGTATGRGKPVRQMDIGDLPEEEEARRASRATPRTPSRERTRAILEPAATQDGDEDAEHVRRYGVDDKDLFTDQREVSPDLIGDRPLPEER